MGLVRSLRDATSTRSRSKSTALSDVSSLSTQCRYHVTSSPERALNRSARAAGRAQAHSVRTQSAPAVAPATTRRHGVTMRAEYRNRTAGAALGVPRIPPAATWAHPWTFAFPRGIGVSTALKNAPTTCPFALIACAALYRFINLDRIRVPDSSTSVSPVRMLQRAAWLAYQASSSTARSTATSPVTFRFLGPPE